MTAARHARDYASTFVIYGLVALAATWPLARDFSTWLLGDVPYDQRHTMWILWHTKEALLGRQPWFTANLLYHPHGISTLVDGVGPVSGLLALPFWYLPSSISSNSAVAAYNGATWLGFALSGLCMYALARVGIKMDRVPAFFAGLLFMMWPSHVVSLYGHLEKAFVGLLPLTVLAAILAYDPWRPRRWLFAPGAMLLVTLLHNANQFTFALLAVVLIGVAGSVPRPNRIWIRHALRVVIAGILAIVISGPLVFAVARVAADPNMQVKLGEQTKFYSPDLLHLIVPSIHQAIGGRAIYPEYEVAISDLTRRSTIASLTARTGWYGSGIETAVTIPMAAIVLMFCAFFVHRGQAQGGLQQSGLPQSALPRSGSGQRGRAPGDEDPVTRAGVWLLLGAVFATLALGPVLLLAGREVMPMPYSLLAKLPGFDVMRTPGRFMMMASVGFAAAAALGLASLMARAPNRRRAILIATVATLVILAECWPRVWMQHVPPPVPAFYTQLATADHHRAAGAPSADAPADDDRFAVLDLPAGRWSADNGSAYMYYQLTHRRPIAWGYLSRQFVKYPIDGMMGILDQVNAPDALATRRRLAQLGYRYVVWHKRSKELFGTRRPDTSDRFELPAAEAQSYPFLRKAFADDRPLIDDDLVTVYRIAPESNRPLNRIALNRIGH